MLQRCVLPGMSIRNSAFAITTLIACTALPVAADELQEVTITAERMNLIGTASTASVGVVVNDELALTPAFRPGQLLETVPGLTVTSHSGEGKANQYMMRGYNLDHGTDLAVFVDNMPVNEPTHTHGQGYSDLNFMVPAVATNISYTKGTYYADAGDFASVGSVHVNYLNTIPTQLSLTAGTFGFEREFAAGSSSLGSGKLLGALEVQHYDGPWDHADDQRKVNGVVRFSTGDEHDGSSLTGMIYHGEWHSTTDQPVRAYSEGLIGRYGTLDPSDGGKAQRASVSSQFHAMLGNGQFSSDAYVISNRLTLWNNFTHYLVDPVDGDQEAQNENRITLGGDMSYAWNATPLGIANDLLVGVHTRFDFNDVSRLPTADRVLLTDAQIAAVDYPANAIERDQVRLSSEAVYLQTTTHWSEKFRSILGLREDFLHGSDTGTNYGSASGALAQPKLSLIFRPTQGTETYLSWGRGFHSDDLRGVNQAKITGVPGAPLIATQTGYELGLRQQFLQNLTATLALYEVKAQSETTYDPDAGQDSAGPGSRRRGFELNVTWQVLRWLEFYGSYSANHSRYTTLSDDGTGHVGDYLPNAPFAAGSLNVYVKNLRNWSGGLEFRYVGAFALSTDDEVQGGGYGEWSGDVSYAWSHGWTTGLGLYNLLNRKANAAEFWYDDRLPGEPAAGVNDVHVHPLEPFTVRLTLSKSLGGAR